MWERMCESFAVQLMPEYPHRAVSYLLCIKKLDKAIDVFVTSKCYKEAYVLASTRLESTNSIITNILQEWAKYGEKVGNFKESAEWFVMIFFLLHKIYFSNCILTIIFQLYKTR